MKNAGPPWLRRAEVSGGVRHVLRALASPSSTSCLAKRLTIQICRSLATSADYVDEGDFARDLRAVKVPKLVIFGKDDRLVKPAAAETYHREFGLPVRLVAGAGHSPMVEQPAETARLLLALERERSR
jgi:pimeloyl-ACP methyl ester carboxylesterase